MIESGWFDPETLVNLRDVVDRTWRSLAPGQQTARAKILIADAIADLAGQGERDPVLLSSFAVSALGVGKGDDATL